MKKTKIFSAILTGLLIVAFAAITPLAINAQNGRYANVYSKSQVKNFIDNLEKSSNIFKKDFDKFIDRSNLNGTNTEDRFRGYVDDYENALDRLKDRYQDSNSWWDSRYDVQEMINKAEPVNTMMNGLSFAYQLESQWRNMRNDINKVADTYDLAGLNGAGWNGGNGGWNNNGPISNPPNWAQGTFYSNNNGGFRVTITGNGQVTQYGADGQSSYGRWYQNSIWVNGQRYPVSKTNFGLRSYDQQTGQYNEYSKNNNGGNGGNGGGWNGSGQMSNPPSWAQGTFYSTNNGGYRLTITGNGQVTQYGTDGQSSYGRWYKNSIYVDGYEYPVTKMINGIRSFDRRTGQYNEYSKNNGGGNGNNNGPTSNPPSWAQGTFYSTNNGGYRLTIAGNGQVAQYGADGQSSYGRWYQDSIYVDGQEYPVTRTNYGIRSYDQRSGQYNDYSKNINGGNGSGGNGGGQMSNPPNWAQGTFYSTNNNGYRLTISGNGQVTQTGPDGQTAYGRWTNNSIIIDNIEYPITRLSNGLSGLNPADGSVTTYRKQ